MEAIRIRILISGILLTCFNGFAQTKTDTVGQTILKNLVTIDEEPYSLPDTGNTIYIVVTQKNCVKCFQEFCGNIVSSKYKGYGIKIIGTMKYSLLQMGPLSVQCKNYISCSNEVLFYFTDAGLQEVYKTPSPQIIIKEKKNVKYYSYGQTMNLIRSWGNANKKG